MKNLSLNLYQILKGGEGWEGERVMMVTGGDWQGEIRSFLS